MFRHVLLAVLLSTSSALAADVIAIGFDEDATITSFQTTQPNETVTIHAVLRDLTAPTGLDGFAFGTRIEGPAEQPCWSNLVGPANAGCNAAVAFEVAPELPAQPSITVAQGTVVVGSPTDVIEIFVAPNGALSYDTAVYQAPGESTVRPLTPASGSLDEPVARINAGTVDVDSGSWGAVKALY